MAVIPSPISEETSRRNSYVANNQPRRERNPAPLTPSPSLSTVLSRLSSLFIKRRQRGQVDPVEYGAETQLMEDIFMPYYTTPISQASVHFRAIFQNKILYF